MLNSQNYVKDANILRAGEVIAPDMNLSDPNVKVYYHQTKGARTHMPDGAEIIFAGGQYSTANPDIIKFLDGIANKQGTQVTTKVPPKVSDEVANAAQEAMEPAGNAASVIEHGGAKASVDLKKDMAKPSDKLVPVDPSLVKQ